MNEPEEKSIDALKEHEIDGENIKGGISVGTGNFGQHWYCISSGTPRWGNGNDSTSWVYIGDRYNRSQPGRCAFHGDGGGVGG